MRTTETKKNPIDFNALIRSVHLSQQAESTGEIVPPPTTFIDKEGRLRQRGDGLTEPVIGVVPTDAFHASREEIELATVREKMPTNTQRFRTTEGVSGWLYWVETEFKDWYQFFAFLDGSYYQVMVIFPHVERRFRSPHTGHVFSNGRICMGNRYEFGRPTLDEAFAKSVLWANGFNAMVRGNRDTFPFNYND